jgi:acyl carrier protein
VRERPVNWGNVAHQRMPTPMLGAAQDISLWCVETRNHIEFVFTFYADVLETASIARLGARLEAILRGLVDHPDGPIDGYLGDPAGQELGEGKPKTSEVLSDTERVIADVWRELLDVSLIEPDDNFVDLGGHSLLVMRAIAQIERRTGVRLSPRRMIFESLAELAAGVPAAGRLRIAAQ